MLMVSKVLVGLVAALHVYFLVLEMFLFTTPYGLKTFGVEKDFAEKAASLAANQGLYNGFLAAGLIWSLVAPDAYAVPLRFFFLGCVIVAGIYGAYSANVKILFAQAIPAAIALVTVWIASR
jgi:putative membrane protein